MTFGKFSLRVLFLCTCLVSSIKADITYTFNLSGVDAGIRSQIEAAVTEAVALYNKHGSFSKHLNIYYNAGVPTAQANFDGVITFGGSRNTRVALHEISHTLGVGTISAWSANLSGGVWNGAHASRQIRLFDGSSAVLNGDSQHYWPYGLNYDSEDGFANRIRHIRMDAALIADMGFLSFVQEPAGQVAALGETAVFRVQAPRAVSYAWYKQGTPTPLTNGGRISGANTDTLQITDVQASDQGDYYCVASGTLTSRPARLLIQQFTGHWAFENNCSDSIGTNHGTPSGSPVYTAGRIGQAIVLDSVDDFVTLPAGVADARDMTVAAWVYWNGGNQWQRIFDFGTSTAQYLFLTPRSGSNTLRFAVKNGGSEQIVETSQLPTAQWTHLAVVLRENTATLYVNGRAVASSASITLDPIDFSPNLNYIGKSQFSADPLFSGRIDDFRLYSYALSGAEVWTLWGGSTNNPPMFAGDPIILPDAAEGIAYTGQTLAAFASDEDNDSLTFSKIGGPAWLTVASNGALSGTPSASDAGDNAFVVRITDPSGASDQTTIRIRVYSNHLSAHYRFENNTQDSFGTFHAAASGSPAYTNGRLGQCLVLDGVDDFLTLPAALANTEDITIAAWVYWTGGNQWQRIFDFGTGTGTYMFLTPRSGGNTLRFAATTGGNSLEQRIDAAQLAANQWVHLAVTLKGNTGTLYVNGSPAATNVGFTLNPSDLKAALLYVGKSQFSADPLFQGRIDDLRIYPYALSAAAVANLAKQTMGLPDLNALAAWWLSTPPFCNAQPDCLSRDLSGDGGITLSDLAELAQRWL
ncbi:MAG TPA: immunoglobulin domain-containing protein [Anaerohalosphaeraceae bacterium]|nr:immunoglobulin domain-containing protein [Anaerohalosphaeraceae bacterium]